MNVPAKLSAFAAALVVAFGAAAGLGALVNPTDGDATAPAAHGDDATTHGGGGRSAGPGGQATTHGEDAATPHAHGADDGAPHGTAAPATAGALPGGLSSSQDGYTLVPERTTFAAGRPAALRFAVTGPDGRPVTRGYAIESERELHLIVVRRDLTGFQHLHPVRDAGGTWGVPLTFTAPGSYRVLADFTVGGVRRTLGVDVAVPGDVPAPQPLRPSSSATTDGYRVALASEALRAGRESALRFAVTRGGAPVPLQPYLGARGHLVALREGDLAYLHVHPETAAAGGTIPFAATFPSAGRYRLFLQFRTRGAVRTAALTVEVAR